MLHKTHRHSSNADVFTNSKHIASLNDIQLAGIKKYYEIHWEKYNKGLYNKFPDAERITKLSLTTNMSTRPLILIIHFQINKR